MPTVDQILPQTIVAENPYTTQPKSLSKNCVKQEERTSLTPRIETPPLELKRDDDIGNRGIIKLMDLRF